MPPDYLITTAIPNPTPLAAPGDQHKRERIVRAKNEAAAIKHVVADTITITRASIDDAMRLSKEGVSVEKAAE